MKKERSERVIRRVRVAEVVVVVDIVASVISNRITENALALMLGVPWL